jgi:outer membrane protein
MFKILISLLVLLFASLGAESLMTLEDAISLGLKNNYAIQIARNQAKISSNNKGFGLAGLLPTIDASAGLSQTDTDQEVDLPISKSNTSTDAWNAEISANWTLFDGFQMFYNKMKFSELASKGEYQSRDQIENSVVAISRSYFNLVQQIQLLDVSRETRDISESRLKREKVRNELGGASSTDYLNAQVAFNTDQTSLLNQELRVTIARQQLNVLLGQNPATAFSVSTEINIPEMTMNYDALMNLAQEHNSSLKTMEISRSIADRDVGIARSSFLPRLSAYARYGYNDQAVNSNAGLYPGLDVGSNNTNTTVGLSLSFNIFNGRRDQINLQNAKIDATNQELNLLNERNRLIGLVRETYETFNQRIQVVALEEQNVEAASQNLDLQRERLDLGVATSLEFRDAQVSYTRAQTSLISARYQARISRLELDKLIGQLKVE